MNSYEYCFYFFLDKLKFIFLFIVLSLSLMVLYIGFIYNRNIKSFYYKYNIERKKILNCIILRYLF